MPRKLAWSALVFAALALVSCSDDNDDAADGVEPTDTSAAVMVEFLFDIGNQAQTVGTFEVIEGSDTLGCEEGTAVNGGVSDEIVRTVLTCDGASGEGTITMHFDPEADPDDQDAFTGPWNIVEATGDFEGLGGSGDFAAVRDVQAMTIAQTHTGEISFD